ALGKARELLAALPEWTAEAVGVALQQLQADVRDVESATLTLSKGVDAPGLRERMAAANDIPGRLAELGRMTRDNPDQL
ncbi:hypothetical protein, partial [Enterobacter hormaechei]|uniref:hypothetical protein n=1 Tax=Enterobacter hormaechei TaxID=158836 RepID=UPI00203BA4D2